MTNELRELITSKLCACDSEITTTTTETTEWIYLAIYCIVLCVPFFSLLDFRLNIALWNNNNPISCS